MSVRLVRIVTLTAMLLFVSTVARAATLTFDDVPLNSFGFADLTLNGGYGGFSWTNVLPTGNAAQVLGGATVSRPVESSPGSCCVPSLFNFLEADFAQLIVGQNPQNYALQVIVTGWNAGNAIYSATVNLSPTYTTLVANFLGIDSLTMQPVGGAFTTGPVYLAMDNLTYDLGGATPVPEPATLLLVGSGLGLIARRARRRTAR